MSICVMGAGAFGTALAISFARGGHDVTIWGRKRETMAAMAQTRENARYLPEISFPDTLKPTAELPRDAALYLLAVPMQQLGGVVTIHSDVLRGKPLVACCKGLSLETGQGPTAFLDELASMSAILTGPSFAKDIAKGLPTALTLASRRPDDARWLQEQMTAPNLRLYRTSDVTGAEIGGALKNVIAIGCGAAMGAGLGVSARAALMTRGFAEICRFAETLGADRATLSGLSGLGDLTLTCTSDLSRNYRFGVALGAGDDFDSATTVEGAATARAIVARAEQSNLDLPICTAISSLLAGTVNVRQAMAALLARPTKEE